ncbi:MAG: sigma 54-interacting transcriptional regulator, partial [bacterium]|nr:sigma 54-interacting transcriptional regulator [bacterium]
EIQGEHNFEDLIGGSEAIGKVLTQVDQVASTDATVLILGETGTGKELLARAVHNRSGRKERPLVKVNCAALPSELIESELFGHEKGAFTGATVQKIGRFELADGGTIFLDEIGDLPLELQAKLLRVLQGGEFERLGSAKTLQVDVRVIAATNRDLEEAVREKTFREDLFYRLNVFPIQSPPLRERKGDIPLLITYFVNKYSAKIGRSIEAVSKEAMAALQIYPWPGNVRELENVIERAVIVCPGDILEVGDWLPKSHSDVMLSASGTLDDVQRSHILEVLGLTQWRIRGQDGAAHILGVKPTTLEARMKKLGIERQET